MEEAGSQLPDDVRGEPRGLRDGFHRQPHLFKIASDLKLLTALVVAVFLATPHWKAKYFAQKRAGKGEKDHA